MGKHYTRSGESLKTYGKSKDPKQLRVAVGMRLPVSVYDKVEEFQEQCGPLVPRPAVSMSKLYIDLVEGALDLINSEAADSPVVQKVPQFRALLDLKRAYASQYELEQQRAKEIQEVREGNRLETIGGLEAERIADHKARQEVEELRSHVEKLSKIFATMDPEIQKAIEKLGVRKKGSRLSTTEAVTEAWSEAKKGKELTIED